MSPKVDLNAFDAKEKLAIAKATIGRIQNRLAVHDSAKMLKYGFGAGLGLSGIVFLARQYGSPLGMNRPHYVPNIRASVYAPDRPDETTNGEHKTASSPAGENQPSNPVNQLKTSNPWHTPTMALALMAGVPLGILAARRLQRYTKHVALNQDLRKAEKDFELALIEYAEAGDEPTQTKKQSGLSSTQNKLAELAANCSELTAKEGFMDWLGQAYLSWATAAALSTGGIGFYNKWSKRKYKDLQLADQSLNLDRETATPTSAQLTLVDSVDLDKRLRSPRTKEKRRKELQETVGKAIKDFQPEYL